MKNTCLSLLIALVCMSCNTNAPLVFKEQNISITEHATIDINYPKAEGTSKNASLINSTLENYIVNQINMSEDSVTDVSLADAIKLFDEEYISFKTKFTESSQQWEALIDSEVTYESSELICIAVNSYLDTGGAHGNSYIKFLNFNPEDGSLLQQSDLINSPEEFTVLAKVYFEKTIATDNETLQDFFFGEHFSLPASIGFSEEGVILLYNTYEIASYSQGITELTIPYSDAAPYLKLN